MAKQTLSLRELNRATLARQLLLERSTLSVPAAVERLVGMQAQLPVAPYVGLWTRLQNFRREDLARAIENHTIVKATLMRATLHLFTARDYVRFRTTLQPALSNAQELIFKRGRDKGLDEARVLSVTKAFIAEKPRTFAEISAMLAELMPDVDVGAMRYTARTNLPLIQVPVSTGWSYPATPAFTLAEQWLADPISAEEDFRGLIFRYLAALGPASVSDMQAWSGFVKLKDAVEKLKPDLQAYRDEQGQELLDLPDMSFPPAETPAPVRFLPEYDNLLRSHNKRTRVLADEYRSRVYLSGLRVAATILVDGFVSGTWTSEKKKGTASLVIEPFAPLPKQMRSALADEAEQLIRFVEPDAKTYEVRFAE